jgi:hypothetical protein
MSAALPFNVSPEAEQWLLRVSTLPDMQPGISYTLAYDVQKDGELTEEFRGEHYSIGYDTPAGWESEHRATQIHIARREFWMTAATLDTLRGKTLTLVRREVGRGSYAGKIKELLVAA